MFCRGSASIFLRQEMLVDNVPPEEESTPYIFS